MTTDEKIRLVINLSKKYTRLKPLIRNQEKYLKEFGKDKEGSDLILRNMERSLARVEEELKNLLPDD